MVGALCGGGPTGSSYVNCMEFDSSDGAKGVRQKEVVLVQLLLILHRSYSSSLLSSS